ncbi:MAG TPA: Na/Pi cotransporter family protein [Microvirga sp.]|nr:Na/Pi cotransporter family protein [Microvirga sp.]
MVILNCLGGIALLIWATQMVRKGVTRAFGARLRQAIATATAGRLRACGTGLGVATALQSSSATGLLVVAFAERGLIALAPALAVMLGADIGSTLVVQALSFKIAALVPLLLVTGVGTVMVAKATFWQEVGRIVIGLALMILSLQLIVAASAPLRDNPVVTLVLERLADDPVLALLLGALFAWAAHSSVAAILFVISLAGAGVLAMPLALALVLGANVGSGLIPLGLALRSPAAARRVLLGNLSFRLAGAALGLLALPFLPADPAWLGADPARQIANAHTGFNLILALAFLPLAGFAAALLERLVRDAADPAAQRVNHLDDAALDRPAVAIANATREVMRLADTVELMLQEAILTFREGDESRRVGISRLDNEVDRLQEEIKLYLARLTRQPLDEEDTRRCFDLILFTTNLEHVGDIIDRGLLALAAKRQRNGVSFSDAGWEEIAALHRRVLEQMRLAVTVFVTRDLALAKALMAEKDHIRRAEREAAESHFQRLRDGTVASIETSALHLDILRDLKRIAAHLTAVAHPILEANGALRTSRLVGEDAAERLPDPASAVRTAG